MLEKQQRSGRVVSIGIAPWGIVERNHELLGHNRDVPCHSISSPRYVTLLIFTITFLALTNNYGVELYDCVYDTITAHVSS